MHGLSGRCMVYTDPSCIQSLQSNYFTVQPITSHSTMHNVNSHLKSQHLRLHQVKRSSINFHQASAPLAVCNSRSRFLQIYNNSLNRVVPYISQSLMYFTTVLLLFRGRVINRWNRLDQQTVGASSLNVFKTRLRVIRNTRMGFFMGLVSNA